jgi:hypothetical protein
MRWCLFAALLATGPAQAQVLLQNPFHDPTLQVTSGLPGCPVPQEPVFSEDEFRKRAHERAQRGVSCWLAGRCRLENGYLYAAEIIPRVKRAVDARGGYTQTSVWALGQRRLVWLRGCVQSEKQARELVEIVGHLDDVEGVQNELMIGTQGKPPYPVRDKDATSPIRPAHQPSDTP